MNKEQKKLTLRTCQVHVTRQTTFCLHINTKYKYKAHKAIIFKPLQAPLATAKFGRQPQQDIKGFVKRRFTIINSASI